MIAWIGNYLKKDKFQVLIKNKHRERELYLLKSQKLTMEVDKEFTRIFERSQMVSGKLSSLLNSISSKGVFTSITKEINSQKGERS